MVYIMDIWVDGGCRYNGTVHAIGAAASILKRKYGGNEIHWRKIQNYDEPTNQRAELAAIIVALEQALEKYESLRGYPWIDVTIHSDSKYAIGCMTKWIHKWRENGWVNARGLDVANQDLIMEASELDERLQREGDVEYVWVPRSLNTEADEFCNDVLDDME